MASVVVRSRNGYKVVDVRDLIVDDKENIRKGETVRVGSANFSGTVEGVFASKPKAEEYVKTVKAKPGDKDPELPAKGRKRSFKEIVQDNNADLEPPSKQEKKHEGNSNNAKEDLEQSGDSEEEPEFTCSLEFLFPGTEQKPEDSSEGYVSYEESEDSTEEFVSYEELVSQDDSYDPDDERNAVIDYPDSQELWASDDDRENIYGVGEMISMKALGVYLALLWLALLPLAFSIPVA